ncbi:hypothetical protein M899_2269 [Bacteriovorax sp. BSW11_IV]|uniref:N-acetyltransferase n=1 Tax=Bacteriovorax sp. BSW11_IV TaxID=1353529 RepID=UPI00038A3A14|nr:N-acetyltransferase [Bacteriovorax sp. BSW11_IV]EQC46969.1 hypothetical protein M899_2269 [Bacteriovorax sp. BSW11_IV]
MKVKDLTPHQLEQVIELECNNIIPILASVGIHLTEEMMRGEVESFKEDPIVLCLNGERVDGFVIYSYREDHVLIKTFNLRRFNSFNVLSTLLNNIAKDLEQNNIDLVISHCHHTNQKSLNFHRRMGFVEAHSNEQHIEFHATREGLLQTIERRCSL